jgi:eukaryotic-like serine/threonine-protein kinase
MHASSVILIAFATAVVTSVGTTLLVQRMSAGAPDASAAVATEVVVPDFSGLTEADARANATTARVALLVGGREPSPGKKPGTVVRQSVPAGQRVARDLPIGVILADALPQVPNVIGLAAADALARLEQAGYKALQGAPTPDPAVPEGKVIAQSPAGESEHERGATVAINVSSGPAPVAVPKLTGMALAAAKTELEKLGFKPVVQWVSLAETQGLIVLRQTPEAGEKLKPGSNVQVVANQ